MPVDFFKTEPMPHQYDVLKATWEMPEYYVAWPMGIGKSKYVIDNAAALFVRKKIDGLILIAPAGCYLNLFFNEVPIHMSDRVPYRMEYWKAGPGKKKMAAINAIMKPGPGVMDIFVINVEALSSKRGADIALKFAKNHRTMACVDEATTIKNHKAGRSKACFKIGAASLYRRALSGTPLSNGPLDVYGQYHFLKPGLLGFTSYFSFRAEFAKMARVQMNGRTVNIVKGYRNLDELKRRMAPYTSRLPEDILGLIPKTYSVEYVDLTRAQQSAYTSMKELCVAMLESGDIVTVDSALVALSKLQQIVCGHIKAEDGSTHDIDSNRTSVLTDLLERHGGKAIIWCRFVRDVELIGIALNKTFGKDSYETYYGDTGSDDRVNACDRIQNDDTCRFLVATSAASKGLTLTAVTLNLYYSHDFSLERYLQSQDRAWRKGQNKRVHNISLVCRDTVDEKIVTALRSKKDIAGSVVDDIKMLFT